MTKGTDRETLDGISLQWIHKASGHLLSESYKPNPVRRILIPKPNGKFRPLGIGSPRDKVIQQAMKLVLEAVLENKFLDSSHGFRPGRGCHTALRDLREWKGVSWFIEGDIKGFFDNIDHQLLANLLKNHFREVRFMNLYWKVVKAGYVDWEKDRKAIVYSDTGTPQGSIISPILSNLILHELDLFVNGIIKELKEESKDAKPYLKNPEYHKYTMRINRMKKRMNAFRTGSVEHNVAKSKYTDAIKQRRKIKSLLINPNAAKIKYVRYADDWVIGVWGDKKLCIDIKNRIQEKLHSLKLELSVEKTLVTNARTKRAKFLGTFIKKMASSKSSAEYRKYRGVKRRIPTGNLWMTAPILDLVKKLAAKEFLAIDKARWTPKSIGKFVVLPVRDIILRYQSIMNGLLNYYSFVDNRRRFNKIYWVLKESLRKTISRKLKLNHSSFIRSFGKNSITLNIGKTIKGIDKVISFGMPDLSRNPMRFLGSASFKDPFDFVDYKISTESLLDRECSSCGSSESVEMHHLRHIKTINVKLTPFDKMLARINRKQVPLCRNCHLDIHQGRYHGKSLKFLVKKSKTSTEKV